MKFTTLSLLALALAYSTLGAAEAKAGVPAQLAVQSQKPSGTVVTTAEYRPAATSASVTQVRYRPYYRAYARPYVVYRPIPRAYVRPYVGYAPYYGYRGYYRSPGFYYGGW